MQLLSPTWILTDSLHKQIIRKQYLSPILFIMITTIYWAIATWPPLSVQFSYSVVSNSLQLHGHQALRHQASLSIANSQSLLKLMSIKSAMPSNHLIFCRPLLLPPSVFPSIRVFSNESVLPSGGQSTGVSASASVLPMNIQDWFPFGLTDLILQSKGLSRIFSNTTVKKHQFFGSQLSL